MTTPDAASATHRPSKCRTVGLAVIAVVVALRVACLLQSLSGSDRDRACARADRARPAFLRERPYATSSYYAATCSAATLRTLERFRVAPGRNDGSDGDRLRLAVVRPFCEFDAGALPATFACWDALPPCAGDPAADVDLYLFFSQTYAYDWAATRSVDVILGAFYADRARGEGWSRCIANVYAIEANIPKEVDLYIPAAQEELYNWINGPNRQFEAMHRLFQSREWGTYDAVFMMEGDAVPIKRDWLDAILAEVREHLPFAILGSRYQGDKWDRFDGDYGGTYRWDHAYHGGIPVALLNHTNGNAIYNVSHPLLERLVSQIELEAPSPYNSVPYDYRMSQMWVEGTTGEVPRLPPKILLNEEGQEMALSNNTAMFRRWAEAWGDGAPFKYSTAIVNYAATNLLPHHLGDEYVIHGARLYSPWAPARVAVTLVVSQGAEAPPNASRPLLESLDRSDHPFSRVVVMAPPSAWSEEYDGLTTVPVRVQARAAGIPKFMDLCAANVRTEWFMVTTSEHRVRRRVDLMFTPGRFQPVISFTPATYPFCLKEPYCKETVELAQRFNCHQSKVVHDMDMLFHTASLRGFCDEWKERYGLAGERLYEERPQRSEADTSEDVEYDNCNERSYVWNGKIYRLAGFDNSGNGYGYDDGILDHGDGPLGPTATSYVAYLAREGKDTKMYKLADRSLYGARPAFVKLTDEGGERTNPIDAVAATAQTARDCSCADLDDETACDEAGVACGCAWRPRFDSCYDRRAAPEPARRRTPAGTAARQNAAVPAKEEVGAVQSIIAATSVLGSQDLALD